MKETSGAMPADVEDRLRTHCVGPPYNVIAEVQRLADGQSETSTAPWVCGGSRRNTVRSCNGTAAGGSSTTILTGSEQIFRRPTETQLRELKRWRQTEALQRTRGVSRKRKRKAKEGEAEG